MYKNFIRRNFNLIKVILMIIILSMIGCLMFIFRFLNMWSTRYLYLIWNMFLAVIPLMFSLILKYHLEKKERGLANKIFVVLCSIIWFFFYPNAPYMITDLKHLARMNFQGTQIYNTDVNIELRLWYDIIMNCIFILNGLFAGFVSLYIMQNIVKQRTSVKTSWVFVLITLSSSSFAIYLGRFLRWNSWDIISNPLNLMISILESIHYMSLLFTVMFTVFLLILYLTMYCFVDIKSNN